MKKYKLKKDTPTIKAGTIFQEVTSDYDKSRELVRIMPLGGTTSPQWTIDDIIDFDEWFEEVKEFEEWKPKNGEPFKMMTSSGNIVDHFHWEGSDEDRRILSLGNCYPLSTPDKVIDKEQRLIPQAMHRLKMAAKKAWFEFNGSEGPDWGNTGQVKYFIVFHSSSNSPEVGTSCIFRSIGGVYFPTEESAQAYIDNNPEDLKLLFGVE